MSLVGWEGAQNRKSREVVLKNGLTDVVTFYELKGLSFPHDLMAGVVVVSSPVGPECGTSFSESVSLQTTASVPPRSPPHPYK